MRTLKSLRLFSGTMIVLVSVALAGCGGGGNAGVASSTKIATTPSTGATGSSTAGSSGSTTAGSGTGTAGSGSGTAGSGTGTSGSGTGTSGSGTGTSGSGTGTSGSGSGGTGTTSPTVTVSVSGTPATAVVAGQAYSFTPTTTVSSGTATFSVQNAPTWASFNTTTGALTGTPPLADVGTYSNIIITASDGGTTGSLQPFAITVSAPSALSGGVSISWTPPTTASDGSTLTDLAGYNIYYGTSPGALTQKVQVTNIGLTTSVITGLASGTWYFVVTSYTNQGTESVPSNVVSATIS
jgi:hypothetical protein